MDELNENVKSDETTELTVSNENTDINESIFIDENDTFDILVRWYKENDKIYVEDSETEFDDNYTNINEFSVTFKYPSQGDYESILRSSNYKSPDEMKMIDLIQMELTRLVILIRKWSLTQNLSRMIELDPMIIKSITKKVRDKIGMKGII
jgi:hypothetical protein